MKTRELIFTKISGLLLVFSVFASGSLLYAQPEGKTWYEAGREATDYHKRLDYFTQSIAKERQDDWVYYYRGDAYRMLDRYHLALKDLEKALKQTDSEQLKPYILMAMAWSYYGLREESVALRYMEKAAKIAPAMAAPWNLKGWIKIRRKAYEEAAAAFGEYISLEPEQSFGYYSRSYAFMLAQQYDKVLADCEKGLSLAPGDEDFLERKALALMRLGREKEALSLINDKIDFKEDDPLSFSNIGNLFYDAGDYHSALEYHSKGIKLYEQKIAEDAKFIEKYRRDVYNIYMSRGDAYEMLQEYPHALQNYSRAVEIDPADPAAWLEIGELQTMQDNWREATTAYEKAYAINPNLTTGWVNLGYCYDHLNLRTKAIDAYSRGIKADPKNGLLYNNRGYAYLELGQHEKSLSDLKMAIEVEPEIVMSHVSLGEYYFTRGQYDEAISIFSEAAKMENGSSKAYLYAYYTRGTAWMKKENWDKAIQDFKSALEWDPRHVSSNEQLGIAYFNKEELCKAYQQLKKALQYDSQNRQREAIDAPRYLAKITKNPCND